MSNQIFNSRLFIIILLAVIFTLTAFILPLSFYRSIFNGTFSTNHETWAEFGSFYGGILAPLFSMLTFFLLIITLIIQRQDFIEAQEIQRSETFQQQARSDLQIEILNSQRLNSIFFNMIATHHSIINSFGAGSIQGRQRLIDNLQEKLSIQKGQKSFVLGEFQSYVKFLLKILEFVEFNFPEGSRDFYINLIKSQVSHVEESYLHAMARSSMEQVQELSQSDFKTLQKYFFDG